MWQLYRMKNLTLSLIATLTFSTLAMSAPANAQTPPCVLQPYKAYNAAMTAGDFKTAIKQAKSAWQAAEKEMGGSATTGDLAFNYGFIEKNQGDIKKSLKPLKRASELARFHTTNAALIQTEREIEVISALEAIGDGNKARDRVSQALAFAQANGMSNSVLTGELHVQDASACLRNLSRKVTSGRSQIGSLVKKGGGDQNVRAGRAKCATIAKRAIDIFDQNPDSARPVYVSAAHNFVGYALEAKKSWYAAAMSYQKSREAVEAVFERDNPVVAQAIGRWLNARNYLKRTGQLEYALENGLCRCWPYAVDRLTVEPIERVDPRFPAAALDATSGYAIVQFDVSDGGQTENIRVVNSFPGDIYDKSAIAAVEQWVYPPKTREEPADFRKGLSEPLSYFLSQGLSPI